MVKWLSHRGTLKSFHRVINFDAEGFDFGADFAFGGFAEVAWGDFEGAAILAAGVPDAGGEGTVGAAVIGFHGEGGDVGPVGALHGGGEPETGFAVDAGGRDFDGIDDEGGNAADDREEREDDADDGENADDEAEGRALFGEEAECRENGEEAERKKDRECAKPESVVDGEGGAVVVDGVAAGEGK